MSPLFIPRFTPIPPFFSAKLGWPPLFYPIFTLFPSFLSPFPSFSSKPGQTTLFYHLCPPISPLFQKKGNPHICAFFSLHFLCFSSHFLLFFPPTDARGEPRHQLGHRESTTRVTPTPQPHFSLNFSQLPPPVDTAEDGGKPSQEVGHREPVGRIFPEEFQCPSPSRLLAQHQLLGGLENTWNPPGWCSNQGGATAPPKRSRML